MLQPGVPVAATAVTGSPAPRRSRDAPVGSLRP